MEGLDMLSLASGVIPLQSEGLSSLLSQRLLPNLFGTTVLVADASEGAGRAIESLDPSVVNQPIVQTVLLSLFIIYLASKTGGEITNRLGLTSILGELLGGGDCRHLLSGIGGIAGDWHYFQQLLVVAVYSILSFGPEFHRY